MFFADDLPSHQLTTQGLSTYFGGELVSRYLTVGSCKFNTPSGDHIIILTYTNPNTVPQARTARAVKTLANVNELSH